MLDSADVVVIGAGVIGTATAYYLAREGVSVAVVERADVGSGSSGHCNGGVVVGAEPFSPLASYSNDLYMSLAAQLDLDFHYRRKGSYRLVETSEDWDMMTEVVAGQQKRGLSVRLVSGEELHSKEPNIAPDVYGAVEYPTDATLDPIRLCWALARGAVAMGARVHAFTEALSTELDAKRHVRLVRTSRGNILTRAVVNAAGCWAGQVAQSVDVDLPITPRRGQIVVTEAANPIVGKKLNEAGGLRTQLGLGLSDTDAERVKYGVAFVMERTVDGNVLLGGSREFVGFNSSTTPDVVRAIVRRAVRFVPELKRLKCIRTYAGIRPFTPDHHPIISSVDGIGGYFVAAGHEGDGISLGSITGKLISEMITGKELSADVQHLSLSRFSSTAC